MLLRQFIDKYQTCPICASKTRLKFGAQNKISRDHTSKDGSLFSLNREIPEKHAGVLPESFELERFLAFDYPWQKFSDGRLRSFYSVDYGCPADHYKARFWGIRFAANELAVDDDTISENMNIDHITID